EAFLLEHREGLPDWRAAHAEILRELAFVQPDLEPVAVDVHFGDCAFDRVAGLLAQPDADGQRFDLRPGNAEAVRQWVLPRGILVGHQSSHFYCMPRRLATCIARTAAAGACQGITDLLFYYSFGE